MILDSISKISDTLTLEEINVSFKQYVDGEVKQ
jgi:hypothetical protein